MPPKGSHIIKDDGIREASSRRGEALPTRELMAGAS